MKNLFKFRMKAFALIALLLVSFSSVFAQEDTIAIIDAGSSGSRLYVYAVDKSKNKLVCLYPNEQQMITSKGMALSTIPNHKDSVESFLNYMTSKCPNEASGPKKLYVLATAGMRLVDSTKAKAIYSHMAKFTTTSNYKVEEAMTISGQYEGLYAWIAANYKNERLDFSISTPVKTLTSIGTPLGIIEIGGASMQITFAANKSCSGTISRDGFSYIYSKSYLGGGINKFNENSNRQNVINGLKAISTLCQNIEFIEIGWAFHDLMKSPFKENEKIKDKQAYVTDIRSNLYGKETTTPEAELKDASWTEGAAIDIVVMGKTPQEFNYDENNPN